MDLFQGLPDNRSEEEKDAQPSAEEAALVRPRGRPVGSHTGVGYQWTPKVEKPVHDAIVDQLILTPGINAVQLGKMFNYNPGAIRMMLKSDLLREKLARRRADLIDPILKVTMEDRLVALMEISVEKATELVSVTSDAEVALKGVDTAGKALGLGNKAGQGAGTQVSQYVVINPGVAPNSQAWAAAYGPLARGGQVQNLDPRPVSEALPLAGVPDTEVSPPLSPDPVAEPLLGSGEADGDELPAGPWA